MQCYGIQTDLLGGGDNNDSSTACGERYRLIVEGHVVIN